MGKFFGIELVLHWSFVLFGLFFALLLLLFQPHLFLPITVFFFFLFMSVFFHELAHSLVSLAYGIKVERIVLLPIGGIAMAEEMPEEPKKELFIAVVGPVFNFAVVFTILLLVNFTNVPFPRDFASVDSTTFQQYILSYPLFGLFWANFILGFFNLFLPAIPLDGGRVFRSLLAMKLGFYRATRIAVRVSKFAAIGLFIVGFLGGSWIVLIVALLIFFGAQQEEELGTAKYLLKGETIRRFVVPASVFPANMSFEDAIRELVARNADCMVVRLKHGFAHVCLDDIVTMPSEQRTMLLGDVLSPLPELDVESQASRAFEKMLTHNLPLMPVVECGELIGVVRAADLKRYYEYKRAMFLS
jgi:Zn-dependent protease